MNRTTIVIDREYGSGGRKVAEILSDELGIPFYDGKSLLEAGERFRIDLAEWGDYDEKKVGSLLYNIAMVVGSVTDATKLEEPYEMFQAQSRLMKQLVAEGPCIFLGRCADEILKDEVHLLKVFIYSGNEEKKRRRIIQQDHVSEEIAEASLKKIDGQRRKYYQFFTKREWGVRENYDICINSADLSYEQVADAIIAVLKRIT